MRREGKAALPILIVLVIITSLIAAGAFFLYQKEHAENLKLKDQIEELNARQKITEAKLDESKRNVSELELKLQESKTQIDELAKELSAEKSAREEESSKLEQVRADLEQQKAQRLDLENRLNQAQDDGRKIKTQIGELQSQKTTLEEQVKNLEVASKSVELGKVVVNPADAKKAAKSKQKAPPLKAPVVKNKEPVKAGALEGKVLVVNKEFNFIVISLGSKDGIGLGDVFSVYRGKEYIGDVKIEKVHEGMSAAGFAEEIKNKISENDRVVQKAK